MTVKRHRKGKQGPGACTLRKQTEEYHLCTITQSLNKLFNFPMFHFSPVETEDTKKADFIGLVQE